MEAITPIEQPDPLIDEIRRIRTALNDKFPNDLKAYVDYINKVASDAVAPAPTPATNPHGPQ